jgi:hypothetical protein
MKILPWLKRNAGVLTILGSITAGLFTAVKFMDQIISRTEAQLRDSKKGILEEQRNTYFETMNIVGRLSSNKKITDEDILEFSKLYYGRMLLVEGRNVDIAMRYFMLTLNSLHGKPECFEKRTTAASMLGHCMRNNIEINWGIVLHGNEINTNGSNIRLDYCTSETAKSISNACQIEPSSKASGTQDKHLSVDERSLVPNSP